MLEFLGAARAVDAHARSECFKAQKRAGADEAVPAYALAANDAFEQERPLAFLNLAKSADRGERVADKLAINRHQAGILRQRGELFESRSITHASLARAAVMFRIRKGSARAKSA